MPRTKRTPIVISPEPESILMIDLRESGIHPLIAFGGEAGPLVRFKGDRRTFLHAAEVASWHEKEVKESRGGSGSSAIAAALRQMLERQSRGELPINENAP